MARAASGKRDAAVVRMRPARKCPVCGRPSVREFYPFDSKRCADADLARWLTGGYVIPASPDEPGDSAGSDSAGYDDDAPAR